MGFSAYYEAYDKSMFVIGMRLLAMELMNPYEDDLQDLSVMTFIRTVWEASNRVLNAKFPSEKVDCSL